MIEKLLKYARNKAGFSQKALAEKLSLTQQAYARYESGTSTPSIETLSLISSILSVPMDYFFGSDVQFSQKGVRIPILGNVAAGIPIEAITDIEDWEEITPELAGTGEYVALRIHGQSMEPRMHEGDVVIVRVQDDVDTGDVAIVIVNGDDATCKKIKKTPDGIMLISLNPAFEPMYYTTAQIADLPVTIFGKVVELRAKF